MKYTIKQFKEDYPDDDTCLEYLLNKQYSGCPKCKKKFYRIKKQKGFACSCGFQVFPTSGTIFHKSSTPLTLWFYAIFLASQSKNGVAAAELQRHLGVTYKCAWRMSHKIRELMVNEVSPAVGIFEADEMYYGKKRHKKPIVGIVKRGGNVFAQVTEDTSRYSLHSIINQYALPGSTLMTDEHPSYKKIGLKHETVNHSKFEYVRGDVYTNTIEGFWSQLRRSLNGTYHFVSPQHLQSYVDEFVFKYNIRNSEVHPFNILISNLIKKPLNNDWAKIQMRNRKVGIKKSALV